MAFIEEGGDCLGLCRLSCLGHLEEPSAFLFVYESKNPNYKHANTADTYFVLYLHYPCYGWFVRDRRMEGLVSMVSRPLFFIPLLLPIRPSGRVGELAAVGDSVSFCFAQVS